MDDIVISGISGRFPQCDNIDQLRDNLFEHFDMVDDREIRWPTSLFELPKRMGKIINLNKFDAEYFGINIKQANLIDPQLRILLELSIEAVFDSGLNNQFSNH